MNKVNKGNGIPAELFKILKDAAAAKVLHSICQQIWKTQQRPQDLKKSVFIPIPKNSNVKECSNYHTDALISRASKVMLKILQTRLQQNLNLVQHLEPRTSRCSSWIYKRQRNQRSNYQHLVRRVYAPRFLSRHNNDLERRTLKPSAHHSSRVLDKPCHSS